jgi:hypothetical protein
MNLKILSIKQKKEIFNMFMTLAEKLYIDQMIDEKLKNIKVQIPQSQINEAVVKFFTEKKWFLTEDGKKLDTYDLIRKFAMNTIGVAENGEIRDDLLKIVQNEVANIIAKEGISKYNTNNTYTYNNDISEKLEDAYTTGVTDTVNLINEYLNKENYPFTVTIDDEFDINFKKKDTDKPQTEPEQTVDKNEQLKERFSKCSPEALEALKKLFIDFDKKDADI